MNAFEVRPSPIVMDPQNCVLVTHGQLVLCMSIEQARVLSTELLLVADQVEQIQFPKARAA